jgi:hypothetical protein
MNSKQKLHGGLVNAPMKSKRYQERRKERGALFWTEANSSVFCCIYSSFLSSLMLLSGYSGKVWLMFIR